MINYSTEEELTNAIKAWIQGDQSKESFYPLMIAISRAFRSGIGLDGTQIDNAVNAAFNTSEQESTSDSDFVYCDLEKHTIPHIDPCVAKLCAALGETISVNLVWDAEYGHGEYWVRMKANIYGLDDEQLAKNFGHSTAYDKYKSSGCDSELRYDGDYNWTSLGSDMDMANKILKAYVDKQRQLYPECKICQA